MKVSLVVHSQTESALPLRHLSHSVQAQVGCELEVLFFHPADQKAPENLPANWQVQSLTEGATTAEVWQRGWEQASGDFIGFFQTSVRLDPHHLACCLQALDAQQVDAVVAQPHFVDSELFAIPEMTLPCPGPKDWPGFCLASRWLWPLETAVFRKSALQKSFFETLSEQASMGDILTWIEEHRVACLPLETVNVLAQSYWLPVDHVELENRVRALLTDYEPEALLPSYATSEEADRGFQVQQYLRQALYNQGLFQLLEEFQAKLDLLLAANSTMWFVYRDYRAWMPWFQTLQAEGVHPIVVVTSEAPAVDGQTLALSFEQDQGIAVVRISGIPEGEYEVHDLDHPPVLVKKLFELIGFYRPERLHLTSFKLYSHYLPSNLANINIPMYYSMTDDSAVLARKLLRYPEKLSENKKYNKELLDIQNRLVEEFWQNWAAAIIVHRPEDRDTLLQEGLEANKITEIQQASDLVTLYHQLPVISKRPTLGSALSLLFRTHTGQALEPHLAQDTGGIAPEEQVLVFGRDISDLVNRLVGQQIWVHGTVYSERLANFGKEQGLPLQAGSIDRLSPHIHYYDRLYTPLVFEGLNYREVKRLVTGAVLALRKHGRWFVRLMQPRLARQKREEFWFNEYHRRPYSAELIKAILEHAGFELSSESHDSEPFCQVLLEAKLMTETLPQLNMPVSTKRLEAFWEEHPPSVVLEEHENVLMMGPHIRKAWLMYRVQCEQMHGISLSLGDLGSKPQQSKSKHSFRHSRNILKTLKLHKQKHDLIILQGLVETLTPQELKEFLSLCRQLLQPSGRLVIQTLNLNLQEDDPLFWQSALNVRPYADLSSILHEVGFSVTEEAQNSELTVWHCQATKSVATEPAADLSLPAIVQALIPEGVTPTLVRHETEFLKLQPNSQDCLVLQRVLEQIAPEHLQQFMQHLQQVLKPNGLLILNFAQVENWDWCMTEVLRPYPQMLVDKLLQDTGLQKRSLLQHEGTWFWSGYRRLTFNTQEKDSFRIRWEGDALNYHSLAVVNRELLKELSLQPRFELEVRNYSDPSYLPVANNPEFPVLQHLFKPLSGQPDVVLRHHWPPDFSMPHTGGHWVMIQPWEFGSLPERWVYNINKFLDQAWVPSHFVRESYLRSGVLPEKVAVVPNGVDTEQFSPHAPALVLPTEKQFKFLYVGGGILRKGIDLLLNAFVEVFSEHDDVCLVVKEFGAGKVYSTLEIGEWIERYRRTHDSMPEILHLNEELPVEQMPSLYNACDCLVHPYRGEGFALPVAEAMACEKPVLVTDYGACLDYCSPDNAYLLPAQEVPFKEKQIDNSLVTVDYPYWAEPDYEALKALLRHIYENQKEAQEKGRQGRQTIVEQFTWRHAVLKLETQLDEIQQRPVFRIYRQHLVANTLAQAFAQIETEDYRLAVENFQRALQIDPYQPSVAYNLGVAHLMLEEYDKALEALTSSLRDGEITADLCYAMGTVLRHLGDYPTSQEFFAKARELEPSLFDVSEEPLPANQEAEPVES